MTKFIEEELNLNDSDDSDDFNDSNHFNDSYSI